MSVTLIFFTFFLCFLCSSPITTTPIIALRAVRDLELVSDPLYSVYIVRHCVRAPYGRWLNVGRNYSANPDDYTSQDWPVFPVPSMQCTPLGRDFIEEQGRQLRKELDAVNDHLDASNVFVISDIDQRDIDTSHSLLKGLGVDKDIDVVDQSFFDSVRSGICTSISTEEKNAAIIKNVERMKVWDDGVHDVNGLMDKVQSIFGQGRNASAITDMPTYIEEGKFAGSLYLAAQASETFLFEYGTGLDVAWGKLNTSAPTVPPSPSFSSSSISSVSGSETIIPIQVEAKEDRDGTDKAGSRKYNNDDDNDNDATADADAPVNMYSLLTLHAKWFNAKFPFEISRNTNSNLLAFLVSELSHAPSPSASASSVSASAKNHTFIVGHDNNVVAMGAMLGLSWDPAPYPKLASPPGCMMRFDAVTITFSSSSADSSQVARRALADDGTDISENTINDDSRNTTDDGGDVNVGAVGRQGIYVKATLSYKIFDSVASPSLTVPVIFDATGTNLIPFKDFVNAAIQAIDSKCVRPYVHDAVLRAAAKYTGDGDDRN